MRGFPGIVATVIVFTFLGASVPPFAAAADNSVIPGDNGFFIQDNSPENAESWGYPENGSNVNTSQFYDSYTEPPEGDPDGLVGLWLLDEGRGTDVGDDSGMRNHGTISGATWIGGRMGTALEFDGFDDFVYVRASDTLNPALVTVSAWLYPTAFPSAGGPNDHFLGKWDVGGHQYVAYLAAGGNGEVRFQVRGGEGGINESRSNVAIPLNQWSYFAATWDGSDIKIYVDGVEGTSTIHKQFTGNITGGISPLRIGLIGSSGFHGTIDAVRLYNRAMTVDEITVLYQEAEATPTTLSLSPGDFEFSLGESTTLSATLTSNGTSLNGETVMWTTTFGSIDASSTSDSSGVATATLTVPLAATRTAAKVSAYFAGDSGHRPSIAHSRGTLPSLVGHWSLDGVSSTAEDSSGLGNDGSIQGTMLVNEETGKSLWFDGVDDYVVVQDSSSLDIQDGLTVMLRFLARDVDSDEPLVSKHNGLTNQNSYHVGIDGGSFGFLFDGDGWGWSSGDQRIVPISNNTWYTGAVTWDGDTWKIYLDGTESASGSWSGSIHAGTANMYIGTREELGNFFEGLIDDATIYNRALSSSEVAQNHSAMSSGLGVVSLGLVSRWEFNDDFADSQGNNHGTASGATWISSKIGNSRYFDGRDDTVSIGNVLNFERDEEMTISAWVRTGDSNHGAVVSKIGIGHLGYDLFVYGTGYELAGHDGQVAVHIVHDWPSGRAIRKFSDIRVDDGDWHHIAYTYDGSSTADGVSIYVDGVLHNGLVSPDALTASILNDSSLRIGSREGRNFFRGVIDEVRIYNRVLAADEIWALYESAATTASSVDPIDPYWRNEVPFDVTATVSGPVENVGLWYRYSTDNSTWENWALFGMDENGSDGWSWEFTALEGDGHYQFYSIAADSAGNREEAPAEADAGAGVDRVPPSSYAHAVSLPFLLPPSFHVKVDASDELSGVYGAALYYRYSPDGGAWGDWKESEVVPWGAILQWGGGFPLMNREMGRYEFYTVAQDMAGNVESTPATADTGWYPDVYNVAYIPVRYVGDPEPERTVPELKRRAELVREYYWQQSFGRALLVENWVFGEWRSLGKRLEDLPEGDNWWDKWESIIDNAIELSKNLQNFVKTDYDAIVVIQPATIIDGRAFAIQSIPYKVMVADDHSFSVWSHELGHALFRWHDYYPVATPFYGDIHDWGIMSFGSWMNPPPSVMSYNKEKAGWLRYATIPWEGGDYEIKLIEEQRYGEIVYRYDTILADIDHFIFEGRRPSDDVRQSDPWRDEPYNLDRNVEGVLIYQVVSSESDDEVYTIPHSNNAWLPWERHEHDVPTLLVGETYTDFASGVEFSVEETSQTSTLSLNIRRLAPSERVVVTILPANPPNAPNFQTIFPETENYFDIDLHIYTPEGKHVGPVYENGDIFYELGIENSYTSRNITGGPEWISVPDNVEFYVVANPTQARKWAQEVGLDIENITVPVTMDIVHYDENGAREESKPMTIEVGFAEPTRLVLPAKVDVKPEVLDPRGRGQWITAYIELPEGYDVRNIDIASVKLDGTVAAESSQKYGFVKDPEIKDRDGNGLLELMVKFDRSAIQATLEPSEAELTVTGKLLDQLPFEGSDVLRVR